MNVLLRNLNKGFRRLFAYDTPYDSVWMVASCCPDNGAPHLRGGRWIFSKSVFFGAAHSLITIQRSDLIDRGFRCIADQSLGKGKIWLAGHLAAPNQCLRGFNTAAGICTDPSADDLYPLSVENPDSDHGILDW